MKHIFFAFPNGLAGVALLLLRASIVLSLVTSPIPLSQPWSTPFLHILAITIGTGVYTRTAAVLCAIGFALLIWPMHWLPPLPSLIHALDAAALALIGPGAFSIDALVFGRRTMHLRG